MTPGCPFRPLGKERGGQTTGQSFQIGALTTHPLPPPVCVAKRPAAPDPAGSDGKTIRQGALSAQLRRLRPLSATSAKRVRREKGALSSGCKPHPANAPAGSNRSSHGGDEMAEAFGLGGHVYVTARVCGPQRE